MTTTDEIQKTLTNTSTSVWLKQALASALERDPVDAANDAEVLTELLARRCDQQLQGSR